MLRVPGEVWLLNRKHNYLFEHPHLHPNRLQSGYSAATRAAAFAPGRARLSPCRAIIPRRTRFILGQKDPGTGRRSSTIIIGTSKSCPSGERQRVLQHQGSVFSMRSCPSRLPSACASWILRHEALVHVHYYAPDFSAHIRWLSRDCLCCVASAPASRRANFGARRTSRVMRM